MRRRSKIHDATLPCGLLCVAVAFMALLHGCARSTRASVSSGPPPQSARAIAEQHCPAMFDTSPIQGNPHPMNRGVAGLGRQTLASALRSEAHGFQRGQTGGAEEGEAGAINASASAEYGGPGGARVRVLAMDLIRVCDARPETGRALRDSMGAPEPSAVVTRGELRGFPALTTQAGRQRSIQLYVADRCQVTLDEVAPPPSPVAAEDLLELVDLAQLASLCARR